MNRVVQKQIVKTLCGDSIDADRLQEVLTEVAGKGEITYDMTIAAALILSGKFPGTFQITKSIRKYEKNLEDILYRR